MAGLLNFGSGSGPGSRRLCNREWRKANEGTVCQGIPSPPTMTNQKKKKLPIKQSKPQQYHDFRR